MIRIFSTKTRQAAQLFGLLTTALLTFSCSGSPIERVGSETGETGDDSANFVVDSSSRFVVRGPEGGPFPDGVRDYEFTNTGSSPVRWEAAASEPWILFSDVSGLIPPGRSETVTVELDGDFAATLPPGDYPADIVFAGNPGNDITLFFLLRVEAATDTAVLTVTPGSGFVAEGDVGGPVTPDSQIYTVQNSGGTPLNWSVGATQSWVTLTGPTNGTLPPGASTSVMAAIDLNAITTLGAGTHYANLRFENLTSGEGTTERRVTLNLSGSGPGGRVVDGLIALYNFDEGSGSVVRDASGASGIDLTIANPGNVTWNPGSLTIDAPTSISSNGPAGQLANFCRTTNAVTLELWVEPANLQQQGPARIFSLSNGLSERNFTLGQGLWGDQPSDLLDVRLRTTATNNDGIPSLTSPAGSLGSGISHIVYTRNAQGGVKLYINGQQVASDFRGGNLSNWDSTYKLILGNETTGDRPWLGTFHLASAFERALSPAEISQNLLAGPGDVDMGQLDVSPGSSLIVTGPEGGPFNTDRKLYTLSNTGNIPIQWSATLSEPWMSSPSALSGFLNPSDTAQVMVRVDLDDISNFQVGSYHGLVTFTNETDGFGSTERDVSVTVQTQNGGSASGVTIVPGDGFNGSTSEPGQIGSGQGATAKAIARWDVVPYQDFNGDFNVGIVAFHMNGIDRVEISCEGGPWVAINEMTMNDRTDAVEYWGTLPADGFAQDGLVELRAIAYPTVGRPRLLDSMFLNCNVNGQLPNTIKYVSTSGSDSANGTASNPYRTIWKAASAIHDEQGGNAGGGKIFLLPGHYNLPGRSSAPPHAQPVTTTRWLTVSGAPGTSRSQVVISDSDALLSKRVKLKNLKIRTTLTATPENLPDIWVDGVELTQEGTEYGQSGGNSFYPPMLRGNREYWFNNIYQTDVYVHHTRMNSTRTKLERNVLVEDIISQGFYNPKGLVLNSTVNGIDASGTLDHPDMIHLQGPNADNLIFYNINLVNCGAQGIFARSNPGYESHFRDIAIVNVVVDNNPHYWQSDWSVTTDHLLWWNIASPYQAVFFKSYEFPAVFTNFSVKNCIFFRFQSPTPTVLDNNHFFDAATSNPLGSNATTGGAVTALFVDPDASFPDFTPVPSSPFVDRSHELLVPVDIKNRVRELPTSIGPNEKP